MKELVTSWIILIVLIALFCFNSYAINGLTISISDEIENVKSSIEEDDAYRAESFFKKYNSGWKKKTKKLLYIYHHRQLEEINKMIHIAGEYISKKELNKVIYCR